jgi:YHS domain-containing protein
MKTFQRIFTVLVSFSLLAVACQSGPAKQDKPVTDTVAMQTTTDTSANIFEHMIVDNKKDPSCGMPVSAGIGDTAHYKDHVLGFCSKECKAEFEKNPEGMLAAAELKQK